MTNFLVDLWTENWQKRRKTSPLFVPVFMVCFFVALIFAGLIMLMDWMLNWTWRGLFKTLDFAWYSGWLAFGLYVYWRALMQARLLGVLGGLLMTAGLIGVLLMKLSEWRSD